MLETTILFILADVDVSVVVSIRLAAALFGVEMAVGVIVVIAVDTFNVLNVPTVPSVIDPDDDIFRFFLTVLPNFQLS